MSSRKILLIIPELGMGGAQRSLAKLSVELAKGHEVTVVVFNRGHQISYSLGGTIISLDVVPGPGVLNKLSAFLSRIKKLKRIKRESGTQVSISFLEGADYINILSRGNEKIIVSVRGSKLHDETIAGNFSWIRNKIFIPVLYRFADVIVTVNHGIINELRDYFNLKRIKIVPMNNFYDHEEIKRLSEESKPPSLARVYQRTVLVTSGRLAPEKGIKPLIFIFSKVKAAHPDAVLVIVGDGPLLAELAAIASDLGLIVEMSENFTTSPDVVFLRNQSNVFKYLKDASLFLMNSSSEGFPNSLVEAMICGLAVVSSDCPYGPREILAPDQPYVSSVAEPYYCQSGVLMPLIKKSSDWEVWVTPLISMLNNKQLLNKMGTAGKARASVFNRENVMSQWETMITSE